ncbi:uncharacterized protein LOC125496316 [Beta vulgaris subsp. vulgaris]|uniref:uncharacterized protein LOC125496316 n=1 Tax=Beta vulgaris subsp. vulgaris TaxID=3555 RepID=UPI0020372A2B|nr:uncharacterized protein LOC125496316 [Beta vulgaris subsp. vulgaris]
MGFTNPRPPEPPNPPIPPLLFSSLQPPMAPNVTASIGAAVFRTTQVEKMMFYLPQPPTQKRCHSRHLRITHHRRRDWFSIQCLYTPAMLQHHFYVHRSVGEITEGYGYMVQELGLSFNESDHHLPRHFNLGVRLDKYIAMVKQYNTYCNDIYY